MQNNQASTLRAQFQKTLPEKYTPDANQAALMLFKLCDSNGNGYLSLAEVSKGFKDIIQVPRIPGLEVVINNAFNKAKRVKKTNDKTENNYVTSDEFIYLLIYLRQYYEFYVEFTLLDENHDSQISIQELEKGKKVLEKWDVDSSDLITIFKAMDKDGRGTVSFRQFSAWAINKSFKAQFGVPENDK